MCSNFIIVAILSYYDVTSIFSRLAVTFWLCLDLKNEKSVIKKMLHSMNVKYLVIMFKEILIKTNVKFVLVCFLKYI